MPRLSWNGEWLEFNESGGDPAVVNINAIAGLGIEKLKGPRVYLKDSLIYYAVDRSTYDSIRSLLMDGTSDQDSV